MKKIINNFSNLLGVKLSGKQFKYLARTRYATLVYMMIEDETYLAEIEKNFIKFGSRSTLMKRLSELERIGLINSAYTGLDSRVKKIKRT